MAKSSVVRASAKQGGQRGSRQLLICNAALLVESSQWYLHEDYGRLVLEQSTWASHYRVEKVARNELEMAAPDMTMYKVVPQ